MGYVRLRYRTEDGEKTITVKEPTYSVLSEEGEVLATGLTAREAKKFCAGFYLGLGTADPIPLRWRDEASGEETKIMAFSHPEWL